MGIVAGGEPSECTRYLIVRYDDYSPMPLYARTDHAPFIEHRLFALAERYNTRLSVGVIPFAGRPPGLRPQDCDPSQSWLTRADNEWVILLREYVERGTVEPALHGFTHRRNTPPGHRPGEFRGQPLEWQREAIRDGRDALNAALQRPVQVFIPPWNAWDQHTADALADNGFKWLSPDPHWRAPFPLQVRAVPQTTADPAQALQWVREDSMPPGTVLVLVTHPFDFDGSGAQKYWIDLEKLWQAVQQSSCWVGAGLGDLPLETLSGWDAEFQKVVAANSAQRLLEDSMGGSLAPGSGLVPMGRPGAQTSSWGRRVSATVVIALPAVIGIALGVFVQRLFSRQLILLLSLLLLAAIALTWLIAGAVNITQQGYAIRGVRWQAIFLLAGYVAGLSSRLSIKPASRRLLFNRVPQARPISQAKLSLSRGI